MGQGALLLMLCLPCITCRRKSKCQWLGSAGSSTSRPGRTLGSPATLTWCSSLSRGFAARWTSTEGPWLFTAGKPCSLHTLTVTYSVGTKMASIHDNQNCDERDLDHFFMPDTPYTYNTLYIYIIHLRLWLFVCACMHVCVFINTTRTDTQTHMPHTHTCIHWSIV